MSWFNSDSLLLKFGTEKSTSTPTGEYRTLGPKHMVETKISAATLTTTDVILGDVTLIPKSAILEAVEIDVEVGCSGGTTVSIGLMKTDRTTTLGATALLNAETTTNLQTTGKVLLYDATTTNHGTLLGTAITVPAHITAKCAGTYTTGQLVVRTFYRQP